MSTMHASILTVVTPLSFFFVSYSIKCTFLHKRTHIDSSLRTVLQPYCFKVLVDYLSSKGGAKQKIFTLLILYIDFSIHIIQ